MLSDISSARDLLLAAGCSFFFLKASDKYGFPSLVFFNHPCTQKSSPLIFALPVLSG
jgi:hypothetical protein